MSLLQHGNDSDFAKELFDVLSAYHRIIHVLYTRISSDYIK